MFWGNTVGALALGPVRVGPIRRGWPAVGGTPGMRTRPPGCACVGKREGTTFIGGNHKFDSNLHMYALCTKGRFVCSLSIAAWLYSNQCPVHSTYQWVQVTGVASILMTRKQLHSSYYHIDTVIAAAIIV